MEEESYTEILEKKIEFLTDILTDEQVDEYVEWCSENDY